MSTARACSCVINCSSRLGRCRPTLSVSPCLSLVQVAINADTCQEVKYISANGSGGTTWRVYNLLAINEIDCKWEYTNLRRCPDNIFPKYFSTLWAIGNRTAISRENYKFIHVLASSSFLLLLFLLLHGTPWVQVTQLSPVRTGATLVSFVTWPNVPHAFSMRRINAWKTYGF